jgi:large-conductance mechanosensitive channel
MDIVAILILVGVALIDGKLWKIMAAQKQHNQNVETLLTEIRDRLKYQ